MKKIFCLILIIFCIPMLVSADMDAPRRDIFDAKVSNVNGAELYDYNWETKTYNSINKTISYETLVKVIDVYKDFIQIQVNNEYKYIKSDDLALLFDINKYKFDSKETKFNILVDTPIYSLPGFSNEPLGYIESGNDVLGKQAGFYKNIDSVDTFFPAFDDWYYVTYNGISGWVYYYQISYQDIDLTMSKYINKTALIYNSNTPIYKNLDIVDNNVVLSDKLDITFEKNIEIPIIKEYKKNYSEVYYYITYNNESGWISNNDVPYEGYLYEFLFNLDNLNIYESPSVDSNKLSKTNIQKLQFYKQLYYTSTWSYIDFGNIKGWVNSENAYSNGLALNYINDFSIYNFDKAFDYYESIDARYELKNKLGTLNENEYKGIYIYTDYKLENSPSYYYIVNYGFISTDPKYQTTNFNYTKMNLHFYYNVNYYADYLLDEKTYLGKFAANSVCENCEIAVISDDESEKTYYIKDYGYIKTNYDLIRKSEIAEIVIANNSINTDNTTVDKHINAIYYVVGTSVLALTATVTTILIAKNRKKKKLIKDNKQKEV